MSSLLITQCLQNDFIGLLAPHEPLPNALHIGPAEAKRLLGEDPTAGPLAQLVGWSRRARGVQVLHIRDWHDATDPQQQPHLARFGPHCVRDTDGARLVLNLERGLGPNEQVVDALTLNDLVDSDLAARFAALPERPTRAAVIGVWTDAKVSFLLYELATRLGVTELATCSALTASASREAHVHALEQLRRLLGVRVFDSVGDLCTWLDPDAPDVELPPLPAGASPLIDGATLSAEDQALTGFLYRDAARVSLAPLAGGFSGSLVFRVRARDVLGHDLAPTVLKLGPRQDIAKERAAFERVEPILGNDTPSVRGFADLGGRAGLKYAFAAMGQSGVRAFKPLYEAGEDVAPMVDRVFRDILGRFFAGAAHERLALLDVHNFSAGRGDGLRARVKELWGEDGPTLRFANGRAIAHPARFYELPHDEVYRTLGHFRTVAFVHGDLNGANILRDEHDNVWLIDFAHAQRGHAVQDLAKLESDLQFLMTPVPDEAALLQAMRFTDALAAVQDLAAPLPEPPALTPPFLRAWATVAQLRGHVARAVAEDRDPDHLHVALLRYAASSLWFDEADALQKRWALYAASVWSERLCAHLDRSDRLRADPLPDGVLGGPGTVALTLCPGRRDRGRDLGRDLRALREDGFDRLLCLLPAHELAWAGVPDLLPRAEAVGMRVLHLPIPDQGVPTLAQAQTAVTYLLDAVDRGERVVVQCMGGLGRTGLIAACALVRRGHAPEQAIALVRAARGPRAVETLGQEDFVRAFPPEG